MFYLKNSLTKITLLTTILAITACNPFSEDKNSTSGTISGLLEENESGVVVYNGSASKGPLTGATISVYAVDVTGEKTGAALAQTTSTDGSWSLSVSNINNDILLVESSGGTYIDESDPETDVNKKRKLSLASNETLYGVLIPGETTAAINFLTHSLIKMFQSEIANAADINQAFNRVRSRALNTFGFDPFTLLPTDPITPKATASDKAKTYALLIGGGAYAMNSASMQLDDPNISYRAIDMLTSDLADCKVDGIVDGQTFDDVYSQPQNLFDNIVLKDEVLRFRNNNYERYENVVLPTLGEGEFCNPNPAITIALPSELINLTLSSGTLAPSFDTFTNNYALTVPGSASTITITPTADTAGTSIQVNSETISSGDTTSAIPLVIGNNIITLQVIAEDGVLQENYILSINRNGQPTVSSPSEFSIIENNTIVTSISASDPELDTLIYSIESSPDGSLFTINSSTGALSFLTAADHETPIDTNSDNIYEVTVGVSDGENLVNYDIDITITNIDDTAPVFVTTALTADENITGNVATINTIDPDSASINYSIIGGMDAGTFTINSSNGELGVSTALDYETYSDIDLDGTYEVEVMADDGIQSSTATIFITVNNNVEINTVTDVGIKTLNVTWDMIIGADTYRVYMEKSVGDGYAQVGSDLATTTADVTVATHLIDWASASFVVEAWGSSGSVLLSTSPAVNVNPGDVLGTIGYFKSSNITGSPAFGTDVAVSADGSTLAISAQYENTVAASSGAVYIFTRAGNTWVQQGTPLKPSSVAASLYFGSSIDLSEDGNTLIVGAYGDALLEGAAYIFTRTSSTWSEGPKLKAPSPVTNNHFGKAVAISADGSTVAIGEPWNTGNTGAVHIFIHSGSWIHQTMLTGSNSGTNHYFGTSLDISGDGNRLIIGATGEKSSTQGLNTTPNVGGADVGAAYLFKRTGTTWAENTYIKAFNSENFDNFGNAVAISDDGFTLAVSAINEDSSSTGVNSVPTDSVNTDNYGAVYTYVWDGINNYIFSAYIKPDASTVGDQFGHSVALSNLGDVLAVTTRKESGSGEGINPVNDDGLSDSGAAYVFAYELSNWSQTSYVKAKGTTLGDELGQSVSLDGSGNIMLISSEYEDGNSPGVDGAIDNAGPTDSGAAYLF